MELLVKIGSRYFERHDARHRQSWRDGQVIDIRTDGSFRGRMERKHHCVIELPNVDFWRIRGSRDWKSVKKSVLDLKRFLSVSNQHGNYVWQSSALFQPKNLKREWFVDFQELLNENYITLSDYESIYDKNRSHNRIVLANVHDFTSILRNENVHARLNTKKDYTRGSVSSGTYQIGTGAGADYATITSFEADIEAQLTGDLTGEHQNEETAISTDVTFDTDTNSHLLTLTAESGAEHNGGAYGNGARISYDTFDSITLDETTGGHLDDVEISKLALDITGSGNEGIIAKDGGDSGMLTINRNLIYGDSDSNIGIAQKSAGENVRITNNIIYGLTNASEGKGIELQTQNSTTVYVANNTVAKCRNGIEQTSATAGAETVTIKNNLVQGSTNADFVDAGAGFYTTGHNVSEDSSGPDEDYDDTDVHTNSVFLDYANNDFRLDPAGDATNLAILDDGEDLSGVFTDDVIGTIRSTWYIGAYELTASSSSSSSSLSVSVSVTKTSSSCSSISVTKTSSSCSSISVTKTSSSCSSISVTKTSSSSSSLSVSVTKTSSSCSSVSVTKTSSSISVTKTSSSCSSISVTKTSSSISVTKTSSSCSSISVTKTSSSISVTKTSSSCSSISVTKTSSSVSVTKTSSSCSSISITKTSSSVSISVSVTKTSSSCSSISVTKTSSSCSSVSVTKTSSSSISVTKTSSSCSSISVTKTSSSCSSVSKTTTSSSCSSVSVTKTSSSSISVTKSSSSSISVTKSSTSSESSESSQSSASSSSHSVSITKTSSSSSSISVTKSSTSSSSVSVTKSSVSISLSLADVGTTVLRLAWDTRIINFSKYEVDRVEITTIKRLDLQRLQNRQPVIYELGTSWKTINVTLDSGETPMTLTKLESLRTVTDIMTLTMFYSDGVTQAEQYSVRVDPSARSYYFGGQVDAGRDLGLVFYEAETG